MERGRTFELHVKEPTVLVVIRGIARVKAPNGLHAELGPCTMLYLPGGMKVQIEAPWEDVEVRPMKSYDMGREPRLLYNGYAVKSPTGEAALCIHVTNEGTRVLMPAEAYIVAGKVLVKQNGSARILEDGEKLEPHALLLPEGGRRATVLLLARP
ncbi:hypothetical protein Pyrfu_1320 [Pyrolobus fumarii 1A]|uniref:Uncharacterized protein n=1 Tax=Pyrolobus fumarii (strain DSM 11204 / 1A) TaxID=694429 RepID=G0EGF4_PYRF1|nr:hypothetical protein Pyrfu_1320 [Pyrolobus fumarii 1A]